MNLLFFLTPKQDVLYIYEDFTLRQTLEKWSNQRYATIPVLKRNGEYVGSITEGDILWAMKNLHGYRAAAGAVRQIYDPAARQAVPKQPPADVRACNPPHVAV